MSLEVLARADRTAVEVVLATGHDAALLLSPAGTIEYVSPHASKLLGCEVDALLDRAIFSLLHPEDRTAFREFYGRVVAQPGATECIRLRFRGAEAAWLECRCTNLTHVPGVGAIVAHVREVGSPPTADEQRLETAGDLFRILVENAVHITAILDTDGTIRYVSPAVERMLGYRPSSLQRVHLSDLIHPHDTAVLAALDARPLQSGRSEQFMQFRVRHYDGSWRVLEAIASNRVDNPLIGGFVVDARDVTERNWSADRLRHSLDALLAIHAVGRILGSTDEQEAIERALLDGARRLACCDGASLLLVRRRRRLVKSRVSGPPELWESVRAARPARLARHQALRSGEPRCFAVLSDQHITTQGWSIPLGVQGRVIGILEVYGAELASGGNNAELSILADQAAGALERARLYHEAAERERRLEELVQRLLLAHEEERRRVAYEVHDGLAQLAAATQQHVEAFAAKYRSRNAKRRDELQQVLALASQTVREARHVIAGLRPTVLDDFGLAAALAHEIQTFKSAGLEIEFSDGLGPTRVDASIETALFRVAQEALANIRKHAQSKRAAVILQLGKSSVRLEVRDWGRGFRPAAAQIGSGPSERVGLAGIQERVALLSGRCVVQSRPGAGTRIRVEVPLPLSRASAPDS